MSTCSTDHIIRNIMIIMYTKIFSRSSLIYLTDYRALSLIGILLPIMPRPASPTCVPSRRMKCLNVKAQQVVSASLRGAEYLVSSRTLLFKHYAPAGCRIIVINATRLLKYRWHFAVRSLTRTINTVYSNTTRGRPGLSSPKTRGKGLNEQLCNNIYFTLWWSEKCSLVFRSDLRVNDCACYINSLCNLPVRIVTVLWNIIL